MEVKAKGSMVVASPAITPAEICVMCDSRELLTEVRMVAEGRMVAADEGGGTHGG